MSEATVVDARLDKLEQDNRRLKLTVGALLLVMAAVPLALVSGWVYSKSVCRWHRCTRCRGRSHERGWCRSR